MGFYFLYYIPRQHEYIKLFNTYKEKILGNTINYAFLKHQQCRLWHETVTNPIQKTVSTHITLNQSAWQANSNIFIVITFPRKKNRIFHQALKILYKSLSVGVHITLKSLHNLPSVFKGEVSK